MPTSALPRQIARLIEVAPGRPAAIVTAFEALATVIQERKRCDRVTALQMAFMITRLRTSDIVGPLAVRESRR